MNTADGSWGTEGALSLGVLALCCGLLFAKKANAQEKSVRADAKGFTLTDSDGNYVLRIRGLLQGDGRFFFQDSGPNTFVVRRARPTLDATVHRTFDVRLMPDFGGGTTVLYDAYATFHPIPELQLTFGKFKPPVGLERLQSDSDLSFAERALPSGLAPNRDVGIQLHGDIAKGTLTWAIGAFDGVEDGALGDVDVDAPKDFEGRVFAQPFIASSNRALEGLGFGVAGTIGKHSGALAAYKSSGQQTFFQFAADAKGNGSHERIAPQGYWYVGPVGVVLEWTRSRIAVANAKFADHVQVTAWQIGATAVLTGEKASFGAVNPRTPFDLERGGFGAIEIHARVHELRIDRGAFDLGFADAERSARRARSFGAGIAWHLARLTKIVADFERTIFLWGGKGATGTRAPENLAIVRLQAGF